MKENGTAKLLQVWGFIIAGAALIVGIFFDTEDLFGIDLSYSIMTSGVITMFILEGFAEIIELLHNNGKKQDELINLLKKQLSPKQDTHGKNKRNINGLKGNKSTSCANNMYQSRKQFETLNQSPAKD